MSSYADHVASRLQQLRRERQWTMDELRAALDQSGHTVPVSTLYAYERGKTRGGVDLPLSLVPVIARAYGYRTAAGWLPDQ